MFERQRAFLVLADAARAIARSDASWETKYDLIFSDEISGAIRQMNMAPDYYDPDTSYEEDVLAYIKALSERQMEIMAALAQLCI